MKVMKFGGTSVGKPQRMNEVARLVTSGEEERIVVLSALSGTTNALVEIGILLAAHNREEAKNRISNLEIYYLEFINELFSNNEMREKAIMMLNEHFEFLTIILKISYSEALNKDILAQGELLSTKLFSLYLEQEGINHALFPALDFMVLDENDEPIVAGIKSNLSKLLDANPGKRIYITQGFITRNSKGEVDNLRRGGSDYSASLIAAAVGASVCEIWTDIDGMHNNDPRIVSSTKPVEQLSFEEAAELAYFGAKILHPASIWPAQLFNVPVRLLNTMQPGAKGTLITRDAGGVGVKAVAAKDNITAIRIRSSRMLLAYGFLRKVFEIFERYKTSIDMITTSEVAVSVTIDSDIYLDQILGELEKLGTVETDSGQTIVSVVGHEIVQEGEILKKLFESITDIPVRMVSYGGSRHNISLLVPGSFKESTLQLLNKGLFKFS